MLLHNVCDIALLEILFFVICCVGKFMIFLKHKNNNDNAIQNFSLRLFTEC